jgi:hypothetical protein
MTNLRAIPSPWTTKAAPYVPMLVQAFQQEGILSANVYAFACAIICHESSWNPHAQNTTDRAALENFNYRGRGFVQISWIDNYRGVAKETGIDFINHPDAMFEPAYCLRAAAAFFKIKHMVQYIEAGDYESAAGIHNSGKASTRSDYTRKVARDTLLWLPVFKDVTIPPHPTGEPYKVQPGDTFYGIATRHFHVTVEELKRANPHINPDVIHVGDIIHSPH